MAKRKGTGAQGGAKRSSKKQAGVKKPGAARAPGPGPKPKGPVSRTEASPDSLAVRKERRLEDTNVKRAMSHVAARTRVQQAKRDSK
ncbi:MAG: hypothetical protein KJZ54_04140 [Phycisphaerales bacterium]|nr:hypothetical protein [Phycisphaerales bacterium]